MTESELEMIRRHIRQGEDALARQLALVSELTRDGHPADDAQFLLRQLSEGLDLHRQHLARYQREHK